MSRQPPDLSVHELSVSYGPIAAVRAVSLEVGRGEIVALLGANGAGKSSTLHAIMGLVPCTGRVTLRGEDITREKPEDVVRRGMTLVPEGRHVFPDLTVRENLLLGRFVRKKDSDDSDDILDLFPILRRRWSQQAGTLSGGEQQQLAMARALMSNPTILLLDEPSLGLAPQLVDLVFELIVRFRSRRGLSMLVVEQNVDRALRISDRAYVLRLGRLEIEERSETLLHASKLEQTYLGIGSEQ